MRERPQHQAGKHNWLSGPDRESERPIVAEKRGNARGAKGPYWKHASIEMKGEPLEHMLDYGIHHLSEGEAGSIGQARTEMSLANARDESFQESRMREIRTSGSMRGE
jgi:hypothetical protein